MIRKAVYVYALVVGVKEIKRRRGLKPNERFDEILVQFYINPIREQLSRPPLMYNVKGGDYALR